MSAFNHSCDKRCFGSDQEAGQTVIEKITTHGPEETDRAFEQIRQNGWRLFRLEVGATPGSWEMTAYGRDPAVKELFDFALKN